MSIDLYKALVDETRELSQKELELVFGGSHDPDQPFHGGEGGTTGRDDACNDDDNTNDEGCD